MIPCPLSITIPVVHPVENKERTAEFIIERFYTFKFSNMTFAISHFYPFDPRGGSVIKIDKFFSFVSI